jgi:hypothetical protein
MDGVGELEVSEADLVRSYRSLPTDKAAGASTWRYEYLRALAPTVPFVSDKAQAVASAHACFAAMFASNRLPT